jgi:alpha-beta hydrolase superfamily lysophospholipase
MQPVLFRDDPQFWYETQRVLGHSAYGGADTGEVLATAQRITSGDYESWHKEWLATAERVAEEAKRALQAGHRCSARDGLLRASSYYRSAEFFLHGEPGDPRIAYSYDRQIECFRVAATLFEPPIEAVEVPYEGTVLLGYFYTSGSGARPTVIIHNGFDGSMEELHFFGAAAAAERGYNVMTFDGPGQPAAIHGEGLVFRPDWEHAVRPIVDWVLTRPEVDPQKVSLMGLSMGGLLAARAAAFEHRLAACIAVDGLYDLGVISTANLPGSREEAEARLRSPHAPDIDAALEMAMATNPTTRWAITHGMYVTGTETPRAFITSYLDYSLRGGIAEQIACPTLVCEAEEDIFFQGQPEDLYDHLTCPKSLMRFTSEEGAGAHCHSGAQRLAFGRIFDWLDEVLDNA